MEGGQERGAGPRVAQTVQNMRSSTLHRDDSAETSPSVSATPSPKRKVRVAQTVQNMRSSTLHRDDSAETSPSVSATPSPKRKVRPKRFSSLVLRPTIPSLIRLPSQKTVSLGPAPNSCLFSACPARNSCPPAPDAPHFPALTCPSPPSPPAPAVPPAASAPAGHRTSWPPQRQTSCQPAGSGPGWRPRQR